MIVRSDPFGLSYVDSSGRTVLAQAAATADHGARRAGAPWFVRCGKHPLARR